MVDVRTRGIGGDDARFRCPSRGKHKQTPRLAWKGEPHIQFLIRSGQTHLSILAPVLGDRKKPPFSSGGQCTDY